MSVNATLRWSGINTAAIMRNLEAAEMAALESVVPVIEDIVLRTVGTQYYSLAQLRAMKHPYRIDGNPPMPPGVVNKQSGRFFDSMKVVGPTKVGSLIVIQVFSTDEERADQLAGTEHAIPRPYKALMQSRLRQQAARQVDALASLIKVKVAA